MRGRRRNRQAYVASIAKQANNLLSYIIISFKPRGLLLINWNCLAFICYMLRRTIEQGVAMMVCCTQLSTAGILYLLFPATNLSGFERTSSLSKMYPIDILRKGRWSLRIQDRNVNKNCWNLSQPNRTLRAFLSFCWIKCTRRKLYRVPSIAVLLHENDTYTHWWWVSVKQFKQFISFEQWLNIIKTLIFIFLYYIYYFKRILPLFTFFIGFYVKVSESNINKYIMKR